MKLLVVSDGEKVALTEDPELASEALYEMLGRPAAIPSAVKTSPETIRATLQLIAAAASGLTMQNGDYTAVIISINLQEAK